MSVSIASYCSGTAGWPKCRSEQWKTVVMWRSEAGDDRVGELVGAGGAAEVAGHRLLLADRRLERVADARGAFAIVHVFEHHAGREHERRRICDPLPGNVRCRTVHGLEDRPAMTDVGAGREAEAADEPRDLVGEDVAEEVRRDDDVEPLRMEHEVHRRRIDDHLLELDVR